MGMETEMRMEMTKLLWMKSAGGLLLVLLAGLSNISIAETNMNQETLEKIIKAMSISSEGEKGAVRFSYSNVRMVLISDIKHDRMRIISRVAEYKDLQPTQIDAVMESNFHKSLDARYALSDGILYSAYIHPLSDLSENQIKSAVQQVANLALSYGREYTSGMLTYGGNQ